MGAVSELIVREYFELHGFFVRQHRKYIARGERDDEEDLDFLVLNPRGAGGPPPAKFILESNDLAGIARARVAVKGWHTEVFYAAVLAHAPQVFRFAEAALDKPVARAFGVEGPVLKVLVLPALPRNPELREQSIQSLRANGVDAVILFHTILADLLNRVEPNRNYEKSDLLQVLRILKQYDFVKEPQLELFKSRRRRAKESKAPGAG
jgi:hypothetical protein